MVHTNLNGFDAGEAPTIEAAENLYFDETKIEEFENKLEIIEVVGPDINTSRYGTLSESQNLLKCTKSINNVTKRTTITTKK